MTFRSKRNIIFFGCVITCGIAFCILSVNEYLTNRTYEELYSYEITNTELDEKSLNFKFNKNRTHILLFVAIFSYMKFTDRRNAIRKTWMSYCKTDYSSVCYFMMDTRTNKGKPISKENMGLLKRENEAYSDMIFMDSFEGVNFAYRFFVSFLWAAQHYKFDFFLRVDDDHYICFQRLVYELPYRKKETYLYWGYQHCVEGITRMDEGWSLFSGDLINEFINNREDLICHKYGDQAVALWINELSHVINVTWFGDDRIHHEQVSKNYNEIINDSQLCSNYISLHGSYSETMEQLHRKHVKRKITPPQDYIVTSITDNCPGLHYEFDLNGFEKPLRCHTTLCIYQPVWTYEKMFVGRQKRQN